MGLQGCGARLRKNINNLTFKKVIVTFVDFWKFIKFLKNLKKNIFNVLETNLDQIHILKKKIIIAFNKLNPSYPGII